MPDILGYDDEGPAENILEGDLNRGVVEVPAEDAFSGCSTGSTKVSEQPLDGDPNKANR